MHILGLASFTVGPPRILVLRPFGLMPTRAAHGCRQWLGRKRRHRRQARRRGRASGQRTCGDTVGWRQRDVAEHHAPVERAHPEAFAYNFDHIHVAIWNADQASATPRKSSDLAHRGSGWKEIRSIEHEGIIREVLSVGICFALVSIVRGIDRRRGGNTTCVSEIAHPAT